MAEAALATWHERNCRCVTATSIAQLLARSASRTDAMLLLAHVMHRDRAWLLAHGDESPSAEEVKAFERLSAHRSDGAPIAYLIGSAGFYGREFLVNESVLIPRPETEHLVEEAIRFIGARALRVLDVGTGCGAIACTIVAETNATVDATDISPAAIEIAKKNADRLNVSARCNFYVGDLTEPVKDQKYDVIVANLPYIPTDDIPRRPDPIGFEPRIALDGGPGGLCTYDRLLHNLAPMKVTGALMLFEAAPPTIHRLAEITKLAFPRGTLLIGRDYAGLDRYVKLQL